MKKTICLLIAFLQLAYFGYAQNIAQWRGKERKGMYEETNLLKSWPQEGPKLLWAIEGVGNGYGSPTFAGDKFYIAGEKDSVAYLFAYDLTGKQLWKVDCGKEWVKNYQGSRCSPTIVDDLIYLSNGLGILSCIDTKTGAKKWTVDIVKEFDGRLPFFGQAESPLIDGDLVFYTAGGTENNMIALNRFTGKLIWKNKGRGETPGYNSPYLIKLDGRKIVVTFSSYSLMGFDALTGEMLWWHEQDIVPLAERKPGRGDTHSNTIWYENGFIYYIAGDEGNCAVKLSLSADGKSISQVWRNKAVDNYMGGFVILDNYLFTSTESGKKMVSVDKISGTVTDSLKCGNGAMIYADKMIYYYNQKGQVLLINPNPKKLEVVSSFKITKGKKEHFAHPVINKGVLYIRHGDALMAYDIKK